MEVFETPYPDHLSTLSDSQHTSRLATVHSKKWGTTKTHLQNYMGLSINVVPPQWMVYKENPTKIDDLGVHLF